jgi:magnesium chelatase family protein
LGWPNRHVTVSLFPASLPKKGSSYDVAIAVALLAAAEAVSPAACAGLVMIGELGLDGRIRAVPGVLPAVLAAAHSGCHTVVVPKANASEADLVPGTKVIPVTTLRALMCHLRDEPPPTLDEDDAALPTGPHPDGLTRRGRARRGDLDLADVRGQADARHAL